MLRLPPDRASTCLMKYSIAGRSCSWLLAVASDRTTVPPGTPPALSPAGPPAAHPPATIAIMAAAASMRVPCRLRTGQRHLQLQDGAVVGEREDLTAWPEPGRQDKGAVVPGPDEVVGPIVDQLELIDARNAGRASATGRIRGGAAGHERVAGAVDG